MNSTCCHHTKSAHYSLKGHTLYPNLEENVQNFNPKLRSLSFYLLRAKSFSTATPRSFLSFHFVTFTVKLPVALVWLTAWSLQAAKVSQLYQPTIPTAESKAVPLSCVRHTLKSFSELSLQRPLAPFADGSLKNEIIQSSKLS